MQTLAIIAVFLFGTCYCVDLKPYNETALLMFIGEDLNGDGQITCVELDQIFDKYDANNDGRESRHEYTEFICATTPTLYNLSHYLYDEYDSNGDHHLDHADYAALCAKMSPDGDGSISEQEFIDYWVKIFTKYENAEKHGHSHPHSGHGSSACH